MTIPEAYKAYTESGCKVLPTSNIKIPALNKGESWNNGIDDVSRFTDAYGIGVICGAISGGLECLDFDNHFGDAKENLQDFIALDGVNEIYNKYLPPIEKTVGGGYHLLYRCGTVEGNQKLAMRKNDKGKAEAIIETRGTDGYFCAYPTNGYTVVKNDIFNIPKISRTERITIIEACRSFNEVKAPEYIRQEYESGRGGERVGDIYNDSTQAIDDAKSLLQQHGWTDLGNNQWRRPNKTDGGASATFGKVAPNCFYVFSSNADPFDSNKAYTPFQILAFLKFNGDFTATAKFLAPEKQLNTITVKKEMTVDEMEKLLLGARIDTSKRIERPPTILEIVDTIGFKTETKRLFTLGNFSCIIGKAKSRKTYLLSLLTSCILNKDVSSKFNSILPIGKSDVLYFDTEQSIFDCYRVINRIERMSGVCVKAFALREYTPTERCQLIEHAFKLWGDGTAFCVIDGIADLAMAINDETEATRVTTLLLRWTKQYNCHIATVLHQNKNDNFATGHLGSSVMKKAEIVISATKSNHDKSLSDINSDLSRGVDFEPFCIGVNDDDTVEVTGVFSKANAAKKNNGYVFETFEKEDNEQDNSVPF